MTTNWSDFSVKLLKFVGDYENYKRFNGNLEPILKELEKKYDLNILDIKNGRENAQRLFKILMLMLGVKISFSQNGSVCKTFLTNNEHSRCVSSVKSILEYISKRYLRRAAISLNASDSENSIKSLLKNGTYTDYLMEFISEKQLDSHSTENPIGKFMKKTVKNSAKKSESSDAKKNGSENLDMISALKVENQKLRKQLEKTRVSGGDEQLLFERIEESIKDVLPELKFVNEKWTGNSSFKKNEHGTAVLHISDWHIGSKENVNGFNNFNYEIACERVKTLANKYIGWTKMHRAMYDIDELVIIATGDMISGDIHEELLRTNEFSVPEQCVKAATLIAKLTNSLSPLFKKVRVEYIVADNHSRTTKKIQFGDGKNSYNYLVGYMSKILLSNVKNVEFNLYPEIQKVIQVEKLRYLITHGNCVRGGFAGIPFYSMQRKVGAEAAVRMNMGDSYHFDKIVMGHYHVPLRSLQYEMTGCLSSTTAFDQSAGRHCRACQTGWIVSKDNEIDYYELWLS